MIVLTLSEKVEIFLKNLFLLKFFSQPKKVVRTSEKKSSLPYYFFSLHLNIDKCGGEKSHLFLFALNLLFILLFND